MGIEVRAVEPGDVEACVRIVESLPDHFTDDVPGKVRDDFARHGGWVVAEAGETVGFVIVERRSPRAAEILWIAVAATRQGDGLGTRLLDRALAELDGEGVEVVEVKTLDRSAGYAPYEATNSFYEQNGFVQVDCIEEFPDWEPGNPAAIYVAALRTTRPSSLPAD
jgi:GNAT superfamily N-acetyltransferase